MHKSERGIEQDWRIETPARPVSAEGILSHKRIFSRGSGCRRRKGGVSDRYGRSLGPAHNLDLGAELMRERVDDGRAEPGFCLGNGAVRSANSVVNDRKLPIRPSDLIGDRYLAMFRIQG